MTVIESSKSIENLVHAVAGAGGGVISMALTYPLITVGTRLQVQKSSSSSASSKKSYKNFSDAVYKIYKKEGIPGFYSGLESALFGIALTNGVYYYWYEFSKTVIQNFSGNTKKFTPLESLLSGALAGVATVLITNPVWVLNTRIASGKGNKPLEEDENSPSSSNSSISSTASTLGERSSTLQVLFSIVREEGFLSLWQGVLPALILVANPSIQYMVFEQLKQKLEKRKSSLGSIDFLVLGAFSKLVATFLTYPYIVVKSRMQLKQSKSEQHRTGIASLVSSILKDEGFRGLYKGLGSKLLQSVLTAAILFLAKESLVDVTRETLLFGMSLSAVIKPKPFV